MAADRCEVRAKRAKNRQLPMSNWRKPFLGLILGRAKVVTGVSQEPQPQIGTILPNPDLSEEACGAEQRNCNSGNPTVSLPIPTAQNPLASIPSVLAIRDLRRRLRRRLGKNSVSDEDLIGILQLDPLAALRGLRCATAPIFGDQQAAWSIRSLVQVLGPALSRRLIDTPTLGVAGTKPLRRLWLHSIATACAARDLAQQSGLMPPDEAYLLGLLHDLHLWLRLVGQHQCGEPATGTAADWLRHWRLPAIFEEVQSDRSEGAANAARSPAATLVAAAELLAELADFHHPDLRRDPLAAVAAADKESLVAAQRLRREVETVLNGLALDLDFPDFDAEFQRVLEEDDSSMFGVRRHGNLDEVVSNVLACARSDSYRGIITALCAASVRFGGYDRAFYVKWNQNRGLMTIRTKADSSARRLAVSQIRPNAHEVDAMRRALEEERPARLDSRMGNREGLLAMLSIDEALVVPLNREFATPSFLVLDRSLSLQPIQLIHDTATASTLGLTGSLLSENLLLRRRRQRAQQFALTDSLTRLFNRRMGVQTLDQEIARAQRSGQPLTVLMCDLDHFKRLNDSFGHLQGDQALRATADVLRSTLRRTDVACRFGGEEFLVVLPDTQPEDATVLATRLFTAIEERGESIGLPITVSIGLTALRPKDTVETLLQRADFALYASKGSGRNRFSADTEDLDVVPTLADSDERNPSPGNNLT
jgi:diguanylate cyclase (GGDEF)-like protein